MQIGEYRYIWWSFIKIDIMRLFSIFAWCAILSFFSGCQTKKDAFQRPAEDYAAWLASFPGMNQPIQKPITFQFTVPIGQADEKVPGKIVQFRPAISGKAIWVDEFTLQFTPVTPLPLGTKFHGILAMDKLFDNIPDSLAEFHFSFNTRMQFLHGELDAITIADPENPNTYTVSGKLFTNEWADTAAIQKCIDFSELPTSANIQWTYNQSKTEHTFSITNLSITSKKSSYSLKYSGKPVHADESGVIKFTIPDFNSMTVIQTKILMDDRPTLRISFSNCISNELDLSGLISLKDENGIEYITSTLTENNHVYCFLHKIPELNASLQVLPNVSSASGIKMKEEYSFTIPSEVIHPAIKLTAQGNILPLSDEIYFPFEARNLNAVDVQIFKIYHSNILHFLQINELEGTGYDLQRVGKIVWQGKVNLSTINSANNSKEFVQYMLDLSRMIQPDPKSIYQVRIGFRKGYSQYPCSGTDEMTLSETDEEQESEEFYEDEYQVLEEENIMYLYYGHEGWHRNYQWNQRNNPCRSEYYNSERFVQRNILASNIGLIAKKSPDGDILIFANDIRNAKPMGQLNIKIYNYQLQVIANGKTNQEGLLTLNVKEEAFFIVGENKAEATYIPIGDHKALSLSDFPVSGVNTPDGLRGFAYTERGVWRPGDSIFMNLILFDPDNKLPPNYPVKMTLQDPRSRLVKEYVSNKAVGNIYSFPTATTEDAPTGTWMAKFSAGKLQVQLPIRVETVKPNRFKIAFTSTLNEEFYQEGKVSGQLQANWLHGQPVKNQQAHIEGRIISVPTQFKSYPGYRFDHPYSIITDLALPAFTGRTDDSGKLSYQNQVDIQELLPPGKIKIDYSFRVEEPGGGFSQDFESFPVDRYQAYCGILSNFKNDQAIAPGTESTFKIISVNKKGQPISNRKLKITVIKQSWAWWWENYYDNRRHHNQSGTQTIIQTDQITTNTKGSIEYKFTTEESGRFFINVEDLASGHQTGETVFYYGKEAPGLITELRYYQFNIGKPLVKSGEEIQINLPGADAGKVLLTVETASRIVHSEVVQLQATERTIRLKAKKEWVPNVYISAILVQPHDRVNDLPIRLYGVHNVMIEDPESVLRPVIESPKTMKPGLPATIAISEANGKAMAYTIAIVDEGLLDLTHFATPNPYKALFAKQALAIKTWDIYDNVLNGFNGTLKRILAIGGDGALKKSPKAHSANRFKPAVIHLGPYWLPPGKKSQHTIIMPEYIGSVRAMVVAAEGKAVGHAESTIAVKKPLMVAATLPRLLTIKDELNLAVTVFAMEDHIKDATVTVKDKSGLVQFTGTQTRKISFQSKGDKTIYFPIKAGSKDGTANFEIVAANGADQATQTIELQIRNPNQMSTRTASVMLNPGDSHTFELNAFGTQGTSAASITAMTLPPIHMEQRLNELLEYPFGCLEQTTSSAFPLLYLSSISDLNAQKSALIKTKIQQSIQRILSMENNGQLAYWPDGNYYHSWSEVYAALFLVLAKEQGYIVSSKMLNIILSRHKKLAEQSFIIAAEDENIGLTEAMRLYMLAIAGQPSISGMNRMNGSPIGQRNLNAWLLAAAYSKSGNVQMAEKISKNLSTMVPANHHASTTFGSELRDQALIIIAMLEMGKSKEAFQILNKVATAVNAQGWLSTQTTAVVLWSWAEYARRLKVGNGIQLDYAYGSKKATVNSNKHFVTEPLAITDDHSGSLKVTNKSNQVVYIQRTIQGKPDIGLEHERSSGLTLNIIYTDLKGRPLDIGQLKVGTDILAVAEIKYEGINEQGISELALSQIFPAGWEIRNTAMPAELTQRLPVMFHRYREVRDDRVNTFFDLRRNRNKHGIDIGQKYYVLLTASYPGRFYFPGQYVTAMYDSSFQASTKGKWIQVVSDDKPPIQ